MTDLKLLRLKYEKNLNKICEIDLNDSVLAVLQASPHVYYCCYYRLMNGSWLLSEYKKDLNANDAINWLATTAMSRIFHDNQ